MHLERRIEQITEDKQLEIKSLSAQIDSLQDQMTNADRELKKNIDSLEKQIEIDSLGEYINEVSRGKTVKVIP